jgi:hypothetical protein
VTKRVWQFDPSSGGRPVPNAVRRATKAAILDHGQRHFTGRYRELDLRFKAQFCYVDAYVEPAEPVADEESADAGGTRCKGRRGYADLRHGGRWPGAIGRGGICGSA